MRNSTQSVKQSCSELSWESQRFFPDQFRPLSQKLWPIEISNFGVCERNRSKTGCGRGGSRGPVTKILNRLKIAMESVFLRRAGRTYPCLPLCSRLMTTTWANLFYISDFYLKSYYRLRGDF